MSKKDKDNIERPKEDVKIENGKPKFKEVLTAFVKKKKKKEKK